jgi:hypothetical protein
MKTPLESEPLKIQRARWFQGSYSYARVTSSLYPMLILSELEFFVGIMEMLVFSIKGCPVKNVTFYVLQPCKASWFRRPHTGRKRHQPSVPTEWYCEHVDLSLLDKDAFPVAPLSTVRHTAWWRWNTSKYGEWRICTLNILYSVTF